MKTLEILGSNRFETWSKHRAACRGIIIRDGKILLGYEEKKDIYSLPGGGVEGTETEEACCKREISEETGVLVSVGDKFLTVNEYYEDRLFETHFFICEIIGETERMLTSREKAVGLVPKWVDINEAVSTFSKHSEYAATDEEKRGIYLREYTALCEYSKMTKPLHPQRRAYQSRG